METSLPSLDTWTSIFLLAAGQGLFLSVLLFQRYRKQQSGSWLAALVLVFSLLLIFNVSFWTRYHWQFPLFNLIYPAAAYLIGPFLLFYLDGLTAKPFFRSYRWLQILPAGIVLLLLLPGYLQPLSALQTEMQEHQFIMAPLYRWRMNGLVSPTFIVTHLLLYAIAVFWYSHHILRLGTGQKQRLIARRIRVIKYFFGLYTLAFVSYYFLVHMTFFRVEHDYLISLVMAGAIYSIGYREYHLAGPTADEEPVRPAATKYSSSSLTHKALVSIAGILEVHMDTSRPYRNNELRLNDLADELAISPHHLSQVINEYYGKTFNQFINEYRIEEAKALLISDLHRQTYIIEIAYQVGFNNKTTFYQAFKSQAGMSPSKWRNRSTAAGR